MLHTFAIIAWIILPAVAVIVALAAIGSTRRRLLSTGTAEVLSDVVDAPELVRFDRAPAA